VDGVYTADPLTDLTAQKFETISYLDVIQRGLRVMDTTAISLCKDNNMPIIVFNLNERGNIMKAVMGENVGTKVS
jgi:uridylate kinase